MRSMRSLEATMLRRLRLTRNRTAGQEVFPFVARSRHRVRWFKLAITVATIGVLVALIAAAPRGRYLVMSLAEQVAQACHADRRHSTRSCPDRQGVDQVPVARSGGHGSRVPEGLFRARSCRSRG